ncbi:1-acylglycerol-3-phosphate O [Exidia glandulosa HHB12029]|uniref:1-acyl-sn-glycerol-3-phosphate acyltransferase n=1 Tax=Exidia glandulosa HHB12029 TaxID=1314781 RepID=A0A165QWE0_EXIGL|nr:1-acylglycerol-3-phosphate O [Exidia glandulosa HHB12029]
MAWLKALLKPVAYLSLSLYTLKYVAYAVPPVRYHVRLFLYLSALGICSAEGIVLAIVMSIAGQRFNIKYYVARSFYSLCGSLLDWEFVVEGEEHLNVRPAVMVGNHQSMIDILYLGRIFPKRASIMAKTQLKYMPLLGQWMWAAGTVFVDRARDKKSAVEALAEAGKTMKSQHTSLWMFPEGTRSMRENDDLLPFKKGAFHLAVQSGLPIIPVVCENYWRLYRKGIFEGGTLHIRVLPPIPTAGLGPDDVGELSERTRNIMLEALRDISRGPSARLEHPPQEKVQEALGSPTPEPQPASEPAHVPMPSASDSSVSELGVSSVRQRTISTASSRDAGADTEEDEGMVLVGRP